MSLLLPDSGLIFWMAVVFAIVLAILAKFGFPAITDMVRKREEYIDSSLQAAKEADERIGSLMEEQERIISQTKAEQNRILKETAQARDNMIRQAKLQAKDEADKIIAQAKVQIEAEKESVLRSVRIQTAVLSVKVAEKLLRKELADDKSQMELLERMMDDVSGTSASRES